MPTGIVGQFRQVWMEDGHKVRVSLQFYMLRMKGTLVDLALVTGSCLSSNLYFSMYFIARTFHGTDFIMMKQCVQALAFHVIQGQESDAIYTLVNSSRLWSYH